MESPLQPPQSSQLPQTPQSLVSSVAAQQAQSPTEMPWYVHRELSKDEFLVFKKAAIEPILAQLLYNRGITRAEDMKAFMSVNYEHSFNPFKLIDMNKAVQRIQTAIESKEHITVYGDYDADGVTSSSLLYIALRTLVKHEASLDFHIPNRQRDGCGLNRSALDLLSHRGTKLIITTDCASSDVEQVAYAQALGIDVIITDHHHPPASLPQAYAMINPWRPDALEVDKEQGEDGENINAKARCLCGVGIAFKLVQALYRSYGRSRTEEQELLDLVAIGTIADIAPLKDENHVLVRLGLEQLKKTTRPGIRALIQSTRLQPERIRERDIAYVLAPRINAAGRMAEASIAFALLTASTTDEAEQHVQELERLNLSRQEQTESLMRHVREQAERYPHDAVVLVDGDEWHEGILGLVAGRLSEEINKPVLVLSNDPHTHLSRGSVRSPKGFHVIEALRAFAETYKLERYGGHAQAAGFTIHSSLIDTLRTHLLRWRANNAPAVHSTSADVDEAQEMVVTTEMGETREIGEPPEADETGGIASIPAEAVPEQEPHHPHMIDITLTKMELLTYDLYKKINMLGPFGAGNPEPVFGMKGVRLLNAWTAGMNGRNLRMQVGSSIGNTRRMGTWTKEGTRLESFKNVSHVDIVFRVEPLDIDERQEIRLRLLHVQNADSSSFKTP